ncbi:MAG: family 10 glycosylhydrolase [Bacteroidales bacterium]|nr:family 10 glycosylhydrolase [Bacteroidales bacterium]
MKKIILILASLMVLASCAEKKAAIPVYVWTSFSDTMDEAQIREQFELWKTHNVSGVCLNAGWDFERIASLSKIAHEYGMEYHAWVSTVTDGSQDPSWYTVNRLGESSLEKPAYVPYYKTLDPHNPEVVEHLVSKFTELAQIPDVDYVQMDYVRYPDVILARGLWDKYGLVMDEEYAPADYCYCDGCVSDFKARTGIDIRGEEDPSKCEEWAEFRCDNVTRLVNAVAEAVHAQGKKISADVFPGPDSYARWMVRQQWDEWDIDAFFPMNYNDFYLEPASWVGAITDEEVKSIEGKGAKLYSGLFICHDWRNKASIKDPEGHGLLPSELAEAVKGAMDAGATGICLFSSQSMSPEHWEALDEILSDPAL